MKLVTHALFVIAIFFVMAPVVSAQELPSFLGQIVPCGNVVQGACQSPSGANGTSFINDCDTCDLVNMAQNIINFFVFAAVVLAVLLFVYAGVLYVTSGPNPSNIEKAHKIFWNVLIGLIIILASWLIVDIVMRTLYGDAQNPGVWGPWNEILCDNVQVTTCLAPPPGSSGTAGAAGRGGAVNPNAQGLIVAPQANTIPDPTGAVPAGTQQGTVPAGNSQDISSPGVLPGAPQFSPGGDTTGGTTGGSQSGFAPLPSPPRPLN